MANGLWIVSASRGGTSGRGGEFEVQGLGRPSAGSDRRRRRDGVAREPQTAAIGVINALVVDGG